MAEPAAPRKTRPTSPTLDAAHEVIRALGLRGDEGDLPKEDAGADSDLEIVPKPPTGNTPAEAAPLAGSVPALCPAWKRGHCTGEDWCPKRHPRPGPDDGALPEVGHAAACAALCYGVAQGWILDETARGSVNIQEAVDRVAHAGQAKVALHTRGRHGGPAEGIVVEPSGMVLVLAADMVRGVLHASRVRRARPQWTIQVYTPPAGVAPLHMGGACRHVAPGAGGHPHRHRGGNRPGPPCLADRPGFPMAQAPGRPPSGARGGGVQPRGNTPAALRQEGAPLPADRHGPGRPARLRVAMGRRGGATATGPLGRLAVVLTHGHPGPCRPSRQGGLPAATPPRRDPAPQPAGGSGLGTVEGGGRAPKPVFSPDARPGAARPGHGGRGMGGNRARHGMQVDHCGRPAAHAIATGVPLPPTGGPLLGPPPRPHKESVEGHAEPHQGVDDEPGWTVPTGAGVGGAHGPHARGPPRPAQGIGPYGTAHRRGAGPGTGALRVLHRQTHIPPVGTSNRLGRLGLQRCVEAAHLGGVVEQWLTLHNPSTAQGHWYLHQLLFLPRTAPEHRRQNLYRTHPERLGVQSFAQPAPPAFPPGQSPEALQQGPPLDTATRVQQRGSSNADGAEPDCTNCGAVAWTAAYRHLARDTTGLRQYRPTDRTALASAVAAVTMGPVAAWPAQLLPHVPC